MKSTNYSEKVMDHFRNPRNVGTLKGENVSYGRVGNPVCGDLMDIYIEVENDIIKDIKFQTFGCGSAVATSSMITEIVKGKTLDEAEQVTRKDVADELDGLPPIKMHCSNLAADALKEAINNYRNGVRIGDMDIEPPEEIPRGCSTIEINVEEVSVVKGLEDYIGEGVFKKIDNLEDLTGYRTLVVDKGDESIKIALDLTKLTDRVVFITQNKNIVSKDPDLKKKLSRSEVKILYQSKLLEISGEGEVEKVKIHDLDENEEYELFIDAVVYLE